MYQRIINSFDEWGRYRTWYYRIPLLLIMAGLYYQMMVNEHYNSLLKPLDLVIHEAGHLLTSFTSEFFCALSGSLFQCLIPIIAAFSLIRIPDYFGIPFCMLWLGANLFDVSVYVGDARSLSLDLVTVGGGGGEVIHDWNYILAEMNWLQHDELISGLLAVSGHILSIGGLLLCSTMIYRMFASKRDHIV